MSSVRLFHIRRALNTIARSNILSTAKRSLGTTSNDGPYDTVSIDEEPPTATETLRFLQYQDQEKLRETHSALNAYMRSVRALQDFAHAHSTTRLSENKEMPAYTVMPMRARAHKLDSAKENMFKHGMMLKEHLTDLQHEPYKPDMDEQLHVWEREISMKDDYEVMDMYQSSDLEDAAKLNRLKKQVDALCRNVNIAAGLQSEDEEEAYPGMVTDPFDPRVEEEGVKSDAAATREGEQGWGLMERLQRDPRVVPPGERERQTASSSRSTRGPFSSQRQMSPDLEARPTGKPSTEPKPIRHKQSARPDNLPEKRETQATSSGRSAEIRVSNERLTPPHFETRVNGRSAGSRQAPSRTPRRERTLLIRRTSLGRAQTITPAKNQNASSRSVPLTASPMSETPAPARPRSLGDEQERLERDMQQSHAKGRRT